MGRILLAFLLLSGCMASEPPRGTWSGTWKDSPVEAFWTPAQPRVGDHVLLTLRFPGSAPEPRLLGGLPPVLLSAPGTLEYRHLVRRSGPFQPEHFSSPLWTVQEEPSGPWIHLRTRAVFTPLPWPLWVWSFLLIPLAALALMVRSFIVRRPPGLSRKQWNNALASGSPEELKKACLRLRLMWEVSGQKAEGPEDQAFLARLNQVLYGAALPPAAELKGDLDYLKQRIRRKKSV